MTWWHDQASRSPLLTPAQEIQLGQTIRAWLDHPDPVPDAVARRGRRARDRFITANLRLVIQFAERYRSVASQHHDDLIQAGNLGLMRAVDKFDPTRGYKFSTYAYWWIRQGIHAFLEQHGRSIRLPSNHSQQWTRLQEHATQLRDLLGRKPTIEEIAEASGFSPELVEHILARPIATLSLDQPCSRLDEHACLGDHVADPADLMEQATDAHELEQLLCAVNTLPPTAQRLVRSTFLSPEPASRAQLALQEGLSRDQVVRVLNASLARLRALLGHADAPPSLQALEFGAQLPLPGLDCAS